MFASFSKKTINILFHCLSLYNCRSFVVYLAFHFWYIKIHGRWPSATSALKGNSIFRTLCSPGIFKTLVYSEHWYIQNQRYIQNPGIFRTRGILIPLLHLELAYSELCHIQKPGIFRILVYSETWNIQNPGLFIILPHSEPWYI